MKTIYAIALWVCVIALLAECDNLMLFIIVKSIAGILALVFGYLLHNLIDEETI